MTSCQACHRPSSIYLCDDCQTQLHDMLTQIPWLVEELDNRIQKLTRYSTGTIGRSSRPDELNVIDFDAAETQRDTRKTLLRLAEQTARISSGRVPRLESVTTGDLALWIACKLGHIARNETSARTTWTTIHPLVGTNQQGGQLIRAINPTEHHLVGPCPTITGRHPNGTPRQCATTLFADTYDKTVTCPTCGQTIDVETTRIRAAADRDLHTRQALLDVLTNIDEPVTDRQLAQWITTRRLRPAGWLHDGTSVLEFRIHPADEPVYSLDKARRLRRREASKTRQHA